MHIPFYPNTKDNMHCMQACLKSVLKYYFPKKKYSYRYLDVVTAHQPRRLTWNSAAAVFLLNAGFEVMIIEDFSYASFARFGQRHLKKVWPVEMFRYQKKYSHLKQEQILAEKLVTDRRMTLTERPATIRDVRSLVARGYLVICFINPYVLCGQTDYGSHSVLVTRLTKDTVTFHDPGLPPKKNKTVPLKLFLQAMRYPYPASASIMAMRYQPK